MYRRCAPPLSEDSRIRRQQRQQRVSGACVQRWQRQRSRAQGCRLVRNGSSLRNEEERGGTRRYARVREATRGDARPPTTGALSASLCSAHSSDVSLLLVLRPPLVALYCDVIWHVTRDRAQTRLPERRVSREPSPAPHTTLSLCTVYAIHASSTRALYTGHLYQSESHDRHRHHHHHYHHRWSARFLRYTGGYCLGGFNDKAGSDKISEQG